MARLDAIACSADTRTVYTTEGDELSLCDGEMGRCFLAFNAIQSQEMRVAVGEGDAPRTFVEVPYGGLLFRGFIATSRIVLFPKDEIYMGGFFRARQLGIVAGLSRGLTVAGNAGTKVRLDAPLRADVACDAVTWMQDSWTPPDEIARLLGAKGPAERAMLSPSAIPLSIAPGAAAVATLDLGDEGYVEAYQSERGARFIVSWVDSGEVFGWVPRHRVVAAPPGGTGWGSSGGGRGFAPVRPDWRGHRCAVDIPILARIDGVLLEAGAVVAGSVFSVGAEIERGLLELRIRHPRYTDDGDPPEYRDFASVRVLGGATLAVERRALRGCERGVPAAE